MKKSAGVLTIYSLVGLVFFVLLAFFNQKVSSASLTLRMMIIPSFVGIFAGSFVGYSRKKWMDHSLELKHAATKLEIQLASVEDEKKHTRNLERLLTNIPLPVYLKDKNHCYILANKYFEELAGKPWSEFKGKTDFDIFPEPIAELFREQDVAVTSSGSPQKFEETVPVTKGIITFETSKFPVEDSDGKIIALGGVCTEITQLKETEDRLKAEEQRLETVLRHLDAGIMTTDTQGRITMFNQRATELTGYSVSLAIGQNLSEIYQAQDSRTGAAVQLNSGDFYSTSDKSRVQDVILISEKGEANEITQKIIQLLDGFGQHAGLLIVLHSKVQSHTLGSTLKNLSTEENESDSTKHDQKKGLILIMDDDALVRKTTKLMLASDSYEVITAKDGEEAVLLFGEHLGSDHPIDAIIMDLTVPGGMGGVEATQKILAMDPEARILVASGYSSNPILANHLAHGFLARVEKPFALEELLTTIRKVLD